LIDPRAPQARPALDMLLGLLNDDRADSNGTRRAGARALGRCGPAAAAAVPALVKRLRDSEAGVRVAAAEALLRIAGDRNESAEAVKVLSEGLTAEDVWDRGEAVRAIGRLGPLARETLPGLKKLRDAPDPHLRAAVAAALARVEGK